SVPQEACQTNKVWKYRVVINAGKLQEPEYSGHGVIGDFYLAEVLGTDLVQALGRWMKSEKAALSSKPFGCPRNLHENRPVVRPLLLVIDTNEAIVVVRHKIQSSHEDSWLE